MQLDLFEPVRNEYPYRAIATNKVASELKEQVGASNRLHKGSNSPIKYGRTESPGKISLAPATTSVYIGP